MTFRRRFRLSAVQKLLLFSVLTAGVALNAVAWMQARAMTHYLTGEVIKTQKPEQLSTFDKAKVVFTGVRVPRPTNTKAPDDMGLDYETHRIEMGSDQFSYPQYLEAWMTAAETDNETNGTTQKSKGIVLLFPQYGASKQAVLAPGKAFYEMGYDVMWVDFRGVGGSSGSNTTLGVREGEDVAAAMRYVQRQWPQKPVILYGASLGSVAVMRAITHEGITPTAAILESPFDSLLGTVRHRFRAANIPSFPSAELLVFYGGLQQGMNGFAHNPKEYAALMDCPVLIMHGRADTRVTEENAVAIYEQLPQKKELVLFSAVGHGALVNDDPTKWISSIQQFLED